MDTLTDFLARLAGPLFDPEKRIFLGYLATALLIAVGVQLLAGGTTLRRALAGLFSGRIWWSRSARTDYLVAVLNQAVMMGVVPRLVSRLAVATALFEAMHVWFDGRPLVWPGAPGWSVAFLFTLVLFLAEDASKYLVHRYLHAWPVLWCFHKVHHTAETLTPFTIFRTHPVEGVIFALRAALVQAVVLAGFVFFLGDRVELVAVFGANLFLFLFNAAGANLRHSHVRISYGRVVEHLLISPAQHQIHHSAERRHFDRNFGAVLAVWDWLGGSLCLAGAERELRFGTNVGAADPHALRCVYLAPFHEAARCLSRLSIRRPDTMISFTNLRSARRAGIAALAAVMAMVPAANAVGAELNIYSHRQPFLIEPFIEAYRKETGTKVNIVYASKGLAQRLQAEGERSPADVVLTVDIGRLWLYADKDLLAPVDSGVLTKNVPAHLRDPQGRWFAFSKRARVIAVAKKAPDTAAIGRYEDLADPRWKGRICVRPGSHVYNRALVASFLEAKGEAATVEWAQGLVDNLARRPQGNDRAQVKAVYQGECDIALINNYYFGKLKHSENPGQRKWAAAVNLVFPNQDGRGTHVNISGGGVAKYAPHKAEAVRFLEFLTSKTAQDLYGSVNFEYPVNPAVAPSAELRSWGGSFTEDTMPIARIAELAPAAQRVIDRVGW